MSMRAWTQLEKSKPSGRQPANATPRSGRSTNAYRKPNYRSRQHRQSQPAWHSPKKPNEPSLKAKVEVMPFILTFSSILTINI